MPSLSVLIGATAAVSVLVATAVTLSVALDYSRSALTTLGTSHTGVLLQLTETRLVSYMAGASDASDAARQFFNTGPKPLATEDPTNATIYKYADAVLDQYRAAKTSNMVSYFGIDGGFAAAIPHFRDPAHVLQEISIIRGGAPVLLTRSYYINGSDSPAALTAGFAPINGLLSYGPVDALLRSVLGDKPLSTPAIAPPTLAVFPYSTPVTVIWQVVIGRYVFNNTGTLLGYVLTSFTGVQLGDDLRRGRATPGSHVLITTASDGLIFGSTHEAPWHTLDVVPAGTVPAEGCVTTEYTSTPIFGGGVFHSCRFRLRDYAYGPAAALAGLPVPTSNRVESLKLDGKRFFVGMTRVAPSAQDAVGVTFALYLLIPEKDILGEVTKGQNIAIGVAVAVFVVATALSVAIVVVLLRPLQGIADRMLLASSFEDTDPSREVSAISEVAELQRSYYAMNDELQRVAAFVPASVLVNRDATDADMLDAEGGGGADGGVAAADCNAEDRASAGATSSRSQQSRHSKRSKHTRASSGHAAAGATVLNLASGLTARTAAVVMINCRGFNAAHVRRLSSGHAPSSALAALVATYQRVVDGVNEAVRENGGVFDFFHGDRFTVSFNAARPVHQGPRRAALTALAATRVLRQELGVPCHAGIGYGRALVGNIGGTGMMRFCVLGECVSRAARLCALGPRYDADGAMPGAAAGEGCRVLCADSKLDLEAHFALRCVDVLPQALSSVDVVAPTSRRAATGDTPVSETSQDELAAAKGAWKPKLVFEVLSPSDSAQNEEWLYVVNQAEGRGSALAVVNEAFSQFVEGRELPAALTEALTAQPPGAPTPVAASIGRLQRLIAPSSSL